MVGRVNRVQGDNNECGSHRVEKRSSTITKKVQRCSIPCFLSTLGILGVVTFTAVVAARNPRDALDILELFREILK